jgi:hypothetical protein
MNKDLGSLSSTAKQNKQKNRKHAPNKLSNLPFDNGASMTIILRGRVEINKVIWLIPRSLMNE